jgi:hypothetical protein
MKAMMIAGGVAFALLVATVAPAFAAGPPWAAPRRGPAVQAPAGGPGAGVGTTIPAEVRTAIQNASQAAAVKTLGMTPQALQQELAARKTMAAIAAAKNVPLDKVLAAMQAARKDAIDKALKEGKINQVQADRLLQTGPSVSAAPGTGPGAGIGRGRGTAVAARPGRGRR